MLVAVGLVILMMTLFATIFQMATGAMSTQKGLAENDQRDRLVLTRIRNDLNGNKSDPNDPNRPFRTFRNVVPFGPLENQSTTSFADRNGYFYISENDPNDETDDVLAFTVQMPAGSAEQFFGRAAIVLPDGSGNYGPPGNSPNPGSPYPPAANQTVLPANLPGSGQFYWPNQPEFDDIQGSPNMAGDSQFAEVCYFLRRGTLYRRVLLVRQPNLSSPTQAADGTPSTDGVGLASPTSLSLAIYGNGNRNFWTDFDYAAYFDGRSGKGLRFHGTGSASQIDSVKFTGSSLTNPFVLGNPAYRFGFDSTTNGVNPSVTYGQPREFAGINGPAGGSAFIGRFTHAETSDPTFGYPGNLTSNAMNSATALNYNAITGVVGNFSGPRAGEDVLMTNVIKFDIKVFDPAASPGPDGLNGVAGIDDDNNGKVDDISELGWPGSDDGDFRDIGHNGTTGFYNNPNNPNVSFAAISPTYSVPLTQHVPMTMLYKLSSFANLRTLAQAVQPWPAPDYIYPNVNYSNPLNNMNRYDTWNPMLSLTPADAANAVSECPPFRPFHFGPDGRPGEAFYDDDGDGHPDYLANGLPDLKELGWPNTDDQPYPLGAIQIKITFYDRTSKQVRESTLVQSLLYTP